MNRYIAFVISILAIWNISSSVMASTDGEVRDHSEVVQLRMEYYSRYKEFMIPWYYLAAIDQYERNIQDVRSDIPKKESIVAIHFSDEDWSGALNPIKNDMGPLSINYYNGMGVDGNGDGLADKNDDDDVLLAMAIYLYGYGNTEEDFKLALWDYYKNELIVNQIVTIAKLYQTYETIDIDTHTFPLAIGYKYSYGNTWGANRGWGGRRSHEGADIYASYGTPVLSASYGIIEIMGWNDFGGWRVGIRDNHNSYHYYAHLQSFEKDLKEGDIVQTGQVIGYVGSSGYGKEGTVGKFPPHLHYGIYKFNGRTEFAFNPYPYLVRWEKEAKAQKK